jgi:hypothetical protein
MRRTGVVAVACLGLAAAAAGQSKTNPKIDVVLTGCMQAEPRPASTSGRPVLIVTNARVSPDTSPAAGSPPASDASRAIPNESGVGTTFILQGGKDDLPKYLGKRVEIRASIDQAAQRAPAEVGTSGSSNPPQVKSEGWPRALVKEIHSIGTCQK